MFKDKRRATRLKKTPLIILFTFMLLLLQAPAGFTQEKISPAENETLAQQETIGQRIAQLEVKLQSVREQIDKVKQPGAGSGRLQYGISAAELQEYAQLIEETEAVILQQITALKKQASLKQSLARMESVLASPQALAIPLLPPYSLSIYDEYLNKQEAQILIEKTAELEQDVAQENLKDA